MSDSVLIGLVEFRCGSDIRRFCSRSIDILWDGHIWYAYPLQHGEVAQSAEITKNDVRFEFPLTDTFSKQYLGYGPDEQTIVTLYRNAIDDPDDFHVFWKGRVADAEATSTTNILICESIFTTLKSIGLGERMQKFCRHVVYHEGCWLDKEDFAFEVTVTAIDARRTTLTSAELLAKSSGYFSGGMLTMPNGSLRYISKHAGDQITVWRAADEIADELLIGSFTTQIYPGCDGSLATCNDRFDNLDNNGGFYWIPSKNPHDGSSIF